MSSICKTLHQVRSSIRNSPTHNLNFVKIHPFSSSLSSIDKLPIQYSFIVNYLVKSRGFPPEKALKASKYLNFKTPEKPDSVMEFFIDHGFTKTQVSNLVRKFPLILSCNPATTLLPKFDFFKSKGLSSTDVVRILLRKPDLLKRSLDNQIIPAFNFFKNLIQSEEGTISAIKCFAMLLVVDVEAHMAPNVEILQKAGVPNEKIAVLLTYQPRAFITSCESFRQVVEEVEEMGFNPSKLNFVLAVHALRAMSKLTWETKVEAYKKWGWSEDEIRVAFGKHPWCMMVSEDKIMRVMDYFVNEMGWESSFVLKRPALMSLSLEKRIIPRCSVYRVLFSTGLIRDTDISLIMMLESPEKWFLEKVVNRHKEEAPELLRLYKEKLALANKKDMGTQDESGLVNDVPL